MAWIKKAYLYLVSLVALVIMVVGAIMLLNLALKTWLFTKADNYASYPICATQPAPASAEAQPNPKTGECDQASMDAQKKIDDTNRSSQKQSQASNAIAMIVVAAPVFYYHWRLARKEA